MGRVAKEGSTGSPSSGRNLDGARMVLDLSQKESEWVD